jgi:hypothetical protein
MVGGEDIATGVDLDLPRGRALWLVGVRILVAMDVLVPGTDVQLLDGGLDLHVQVKVGTEERTRRWVWLSDETTRSREASLVVQEESEAA